MAEAGRSTCLSLKYFAYFTIILVIFISIAECKKKDKGSSGDDWKKKDLTFYSDADMERLYEQWEENDDDELEEDELPEWKRPQPKIDLSKLDPNDPEGMLKMSKKGKTLMMFAQVAGNPTEAETEKISTLWQSSLHNANIDLQRYVVASNRVLLVVRDGAIAFDVKNFLVTQEDCELVTIEGKDYYNEKYQPKNAEDNSTKKKTEKKKSKKNKKNKAEEEENKIRENINNEILKNQKLKDEL